MGEWMNDDAIETSEDLGQIYAVDNGFQNLV